MLSCSSKPDKYAVLKTAGQADEQLLPQLEEDFAGSQVEGDPAVGKTGKLGGK